MSRLKKLEKGQGSPQSNEMMNTLDGNKKLFNIFAGWPTARPSSIPT